MARSRVENGFYHCKKCGNLFEKKKEWKRAVCGPCARAGRKEKQAVYMKWWYINVRKPKREKMRGEKNV